MAVIKWQCSHCGTIANTYKPGDRPHPGECVKQGKAANGKWKPHSWKKA